MKRISIYFRINEGMKCIYCNKKFIDSNYLQKHIYDKHEIYCPICGIELKRNKARHIRTHSSKKVYQCKKCPKSYTRNEHLRRHNLRHKKKNKSKY